MRAGLLAQIYTARTRCGRLACPTASRPTRSVLVKLRMPDMIELSTRDHSGKASASHSHSHQHPPQPTPLSHPPTPSNSAQALHSHSHDHGHGHGHGHSHGVLGHSHSHGEEDGHGMELIETLEAGGAFRLIYTLGPAAHTRKSRRQRPTNNHNWACSERSAHNSKRTRGVVHELGRTSR